MSKDMEVMKGFREVLNKLIALNEDQMKVALAGYKSSEIHCLEYIGQHPDANLTSVAEAFYMTRGAISKLTKKMVEKDLIARYQTSENKKEVHLRLTEKGRDLFEKHEALHAGFRQRDQEVFDQVGEDALDAMIRFTTLYASHLDRQLKEKGIHVERIGLMDEA